MAGEISQRSALLTEGIAGVSTPKKGHSDIVKTFRSRKIDFSKDLILLLESQEPKEHLLQMRPVPLLSTGVDKEEEDETHLKAILSTAPTFSRMGGEAARIPVPEASEGRDAISAELYNQLYPPTGEVYNKDEFWKAPAPSRIFDPVNNPFFSNHGSSGLYCQNNLLGFGFGARSPTCMLPSERKGLSEKKRKDPYVAYWATGTDVAFLSKLPSISISTFEKVMWILESMALVYGFEGVSSDFLSSKHSSPFVERWLEQSEIAGVSSAQSLIYEHWKKSRVKLSPNCNIPLIPTLKHEETKLNNNNIDAYVCFRRREIRQPRKTRRADLDALTKLCRLQEQFEDLLGILRLALQRDQLKKSLLLETSFVFSHTFTLEIMKVKYGITVPPIVVPDSPMRHGHHHHHRYSNKLVSYSDVLKKPELDGPPALFWDIGSQSYQRVAFFMDLAKTSSTEKKFEHISSWKDLIDPTKVSSSIVERLSTLEQELADYYQSQQPNSSDACYRQSLLARERFEYYLGSMNNATAPAFRIGRCNRTLPINRS